MTRMDLIKFNFKRLRKAKGWSQKELAKKGKVSPGYIGQIEAGLLKSFGAKAETRWAKIFNVSITEFFYDPYTAPLDKSELVELLSDNDVLSKLRAIRNQFPGQTDRDRIISELSTVPRKRRPVKKKKHSA